RRQEADAVPHPVTQVEQPEARDFVAREVDGEEYATWWARAVAAYPPYEEYQEKTDRKIPVFVASPKD
ncbi:MAG: nitroreductase family deazaflavin-dependent oxidoreductase, partial [Thermoplasmata archaeon]|nr:nitroreductase family deazaflavin-dependent oxidoreductase [Thermoplasmata archaeon]